MPRRTNRWKFGRLAAGSVQRNATRYAQDPRKLADLLRSAQRKVREQQGALRDVQDDLALLLRMLRAWIDGSYRTIPWQTLLRITAAVLYFVMPIDLIPDPLAGIGFIDDVAVIAWTVRAIHSDLEQFRAWEQAQEGADDPLE